MKLSEILSGPEKWCQGAHQQGGRFCIEGAVMELTAAETGRRLCGPEHSRLLRVINADYPYYATVPSWNDHPHRTWDEVAAVVEAYDRDRMVNP